MRRLIEKNNNEKNYRCAPSLSEKFLSFISTLFLSAAVAHWVSRWPSVPEVVTSGLAEV